MKHNDKIRVLIADDHFVVRVGLTSMIGSESDMEVVGEAATGIEAIQLFRKHRPDITLMDLRMPDINGVEATQQIRQQDPEAKVIVLTTYEEDENIHRAFEAGARAYLLKDIPGEEFLNDIRVVYQGEYCIPPAIAANPNSMATATLDLALFPGGPILPGPNGMVVIETEDFDANIPQGNHHWTLITTPEGFSGAGTMYSLPDSGDNLNPPEVLGSSPRLDFDVDFDQTGTHYIWYRGSDGGGDSLHVGLDGTLPNTGERIDSGCCGDRQDGGADLVWVSDLNESKVDVNGLDSPRARFEVDSQGRHTVNVWMREDGMIVDKLIVTPDESVFPSGTGPNSSPRSELEPLPNPEIVFTQPPQDQTVLERETATFNVEIQATSDGNPVSDLLVHWVRDGEIVEEGLSYTTEVLSVEDDGSQIQVLAHIPGLRTLSDPATLTVQADTIPPELNSRARGHPSLRLVTLNFSEELEEASAEDASHYEITHDGGSVAVNNAQLAADGRQVVLETDAQTIGTRYTVTVNSVTDLSGNNVPSDSQAFFFGLGPVEQDPEGNVVLEGENYTDNVPQGSHEWVFITSPTGFSGTGTMITSPSDDGANVGAPPEVFTDSPRLDFEANFTETGTHYIWFRGSDGGGNSIHIGLNGDLPETGIRIDGGCCGTRAPGGTSLVWVSDLNASVVDVNGVDSPRARFEVPAAGLHTVNLWMRESGTIVDKILVTPDPDFVPAGMGPDESNREGAPALPEVSISSPVEGANPAAHSDITLELDINSPSGNPVLAEFFVDGQKIGETDASPFSFVWENVPQGRYTLTARVTNDLQDSGASTPVNITVGSPPPLVLFLIDTDPNTADAAIEAHLQDLGLDVVVVDDDASTPSMADGKSLIVISSTVSSGDVGNKYQSSEVPVVNWEQALQDNFMMTGDVDGTDRGTTGDQTSLTIVDDAHPLAGGLSAGDQEVSTGPTGFAWGLPEASAASIAHIVGNPNQVVIYGYELGDTMFNGFTAPARRVMIFLTNDTFVSLNDNGMALFDAALEWASELTLPLPMQPDQPMLGVTRSAAEITLDWQETGFKLQEASELGNPQWTDVPNGGSSPVVLPLEGDESYFRLISN